MRAVILSNATGSFRPSRLMTNILARRVKREVSTFQEFNTAACFLAIWMRSGVQRCLLSSREEPLLCRAGAPVPCGVVAFAGQRAGRGNNDHGPLKRFRCDRFLARGRAIFGQSNTKVEFNSNELIQFSIWL